MAATTNKTATTSPSPPYNNLPLLVDLLKQKDIFAKSWSEQPNRRDDDISTRRGKGKVVNYFSWMMRMMIIIIMVSIIIIPHNNDDNNDDGV